MIAFNVRTVQASVKHCRYEKCTLCPFKNKVNFLNIESKKFIGLYEIIADLSIGSD